LHPEVLAETPAIEAFEASIGEYVQKRITLDQLGKGYIEFLSRTEFYRTRELLAKHYLMSICGEAPEIISLCKWKRTEKRKLDRVALKATAPEQFNEFVTTVPYTVTKPDRGAGAAAGEGR
jgi:hypothetical protein